MNFIKEFCTWLIYKIRYIKLWSKLYNLGENFYYSFLPKKTLPIKITEKKKLSFRLAGRKLRDDSAYNPFYKWPPNLNCFCGSAVKFKKCHQDSILPYCTKKEAEILAPDFKKALNQIQKLKENGQSFRLRNRIL